MAKQSMYDWQANILEKDLPKLAQSFNIKRQDDIKRLKNSGLPYVHNFITTYSDFSRQNLELIEFMLGNDEFMVRVLPKKSAKGFPRTYKRGGLFTFENCKEFLEYTFLQNPKYKGKQDSYDIYLAETTQQRAGGVILSNMEGIRMEIKKETAGKGGLPRLCYGDKPDQGMILDLTRIGHIEDKITWMQDEQKLSETMLRALKHIQINSKSDNFSPLFMRGYFEFLHLKPDRIIFSDYKNQKFFQR